MTIKSENDENFGDGIVIVDFFTQWCQPCKVLTPMLDKVSTNYPNIAVAKIDIQYKLDLATKYKISSVPSLIVFKDGVEIDRVIGLPSKTNLEALFQKHSQ